jgi:hypothetical protein
MTIAKIDNCGIGLNNDLSPEELGNGVWSSVNNMRFRNGYAERFRGAVASFTTPVVTPYYLTPYTTTTKRYWVHAGTAAVYADDGTTQTNITQNSFTGSVDDKWTGGSVNGVLVLNNSVDTPQYWGGNTAQKLQNLPGWSSTWKAKSIRPFKNYLIALGITKSGDSFPNMVKWSDVAVPGAIPNSWDETNPALDAGEQDLAETPDLLVDCLQLGDVNVVYKERSMYSMTFIGAPFIFRFQRLPGEHGMLTAGCGVQTPQGHVVLTAGDVVLNTGQGVTSIANASVRDYIFKNIDATNYKRSFVTANPQKNEVWICFPYGSSTTCNTACVWNWDDKSWGIRSLNNVTYGAFGQVEVFNTTTWSDADSWESDASTWNENEYSPAEARLVMCHTTPMISLQDIGTADFGNSFPATAERTGIHLDTPSNVKTLRAILPRIDGVAGASLQIQVGSSMTPDSDPIWQAPQTYTIGSSYKVDTFATGRYFAVRFISTGFPGWRMKSFDIDYVDAGYF